MAQDAGRVPAWRRLGLALKNQHQSGVAVPDHQTPSASHGEHQVSQDQSQSGIEPAVNGNPSKLGKRKHQHEPSAQHEQESKKSRLAVTENETNRHAHHELPEPAMAESAKGEAVTGDAPASAKPVKGDSNYRKKKEKPAKGRKSKQDAPDANTQPLGKSSRAPALSPDEPPERQTLLASTEMDHVTPPSFATPQKPLKKSSRKDPSGSPPLTDRRKSVAFTPDTKRTDGNTGQDYFKAWVAEQKGTGEVSQPPEVSNFVLQALIADEEKTARKNGQLEKKQENDEAAGLRAKDPKSEEKPSPKPAKAEKVTPKPEEPKPATKTPNKQNTAAAKGKKKDPTVYIAYLTQYHNDRDNWKFNKAKQNDVVDNALNIFRIPIEHSEALVTYVAGLQGAGVIDRLRERCHATLKDLDAQDAQMDDAEARKVAQEEAEQERIAKERKRRRTEGDLANLADHPYSPGFIRRLQRRRAEALLNALGRAAPVAPAIAPTSSLNPLMKHVEPAKSNARKRKRRSEVSSDESSSDSSSDDSSDSDSDSDPDSSDSDSGSDSDGSSKKNASSSEDESGSSSDSSSSDSSSDSDSD
ncbi:proteasome subunit alpha type 6 protein [Stemphylium lycopersici]|nr:proteasome subunit alpha type 6 protein [Stemphylium lycopersici]